MIHSYFDFGLKNSSFRLPYEFPSSSADFVRELFKGSSGSASLIDCTRKKFFGSTRFVTRTRVEIFLRKATCVWAFFSNNPRKQPDTKVLIAH